MDLWSAASQGNVEAVERFLDAGVPVGRTRWSGITALHRAAQEGHPEVVTLLVQRGADVQAKTTWGWYTPLHLACKGGHDEAALALVSNGANTMCTDKAGRTCVDWAVAAGHKELPGMLDQAMARYMRLEAERQQKGMSAEARRKMSDLGRHKLRMQLQD